MKRLSSIIVLLAFAVVSVAAKPIAQGAAAAASGLTVSDAKLGKSVENKEIKDEATEFAVGEKAYIWLKTSGGTGDLKINWKLGDATDSVSLTVGGTPWRTWSSKTLHKAGSWTVTVTDAGGATLKEMTFTVK